MADDAGRRRKIKLESDAHMAVWVAGWLFTIGYLHLACRARARGSRGCALAR